MKKILPLTDDAGEVRELTREDFRRSRPAIDVLPEILGVELANAILKRKPGQRGKQISPKKELVTIRLTIDVLDFFRSMGPGWQTRMNTALKEWVKEHRA